MNDGALIFLSAGEVSGDVHGAALAARLRQVRPDLRLMGVGGPRMAAAGVTLVADVTAHSAVGLTENLPHVRAVMRAFKDAEAAIAVHRPDCVVLIDYQGANVRLAIRARALGVPTAYYILPQEWLWGLPGGAAMVAASADRLIAVFHGEAETYAAAGGRVDFVGHPLMDLLAEVSPAPAPGSPFVALLPGSRPQEVRRLLPPFLGAAALIAARHPGARFLLPVPAPALEAEVRAAVARTGLPIDVATDAGPADWASADVALAASGTVVLEAAILDVPCVAAYRVSALTAFLARRLLKVRHVTLPNIVAGRAVVPELLQGDARADRLAEAALQLIADPEPIRAGYAEVRALLGGPGAIARAAAIILETADLTAYPAMEHASICHTTHPSPLPGGGELPSGDKRNPGTF